MFPLTPPPSPQPLQAALVAKRQGGRILGGGGDTKRRGSMKDPVSLTLTSVFWSSSCWAMCVVNAMIFVVVKPHSAQQLASIDRRTLGTRLTPGGERGEGQEGRKGAGVETTKEEEEEEKGTRRRAEEREEIYTPVQHDHGRVESREERRSSGEKGAYTGDSKAGDDGYHAYIIQQLERVIAAISRAAALGYNKLSIEKMKEGASDILIIVDENEKREAAAAAAHTQQ
ncbi:hypothetical protein PRIPAC_83623 [Pristionchus pacificus]|uniref:Uncharacterized protein n=1 Tax=Pristionchus pacificus TaxID=54126 RepID=A0A2A6BSU1_PRIPA|nr:hypothetical protein PRIPAC_83623 [Pristionchus pacificus]|eukprot:PDM68873.1 hypothetical protein PRIPAC_47175 [Pristionchus pacificus]